MKLLILFFISSLALAHDSGMNSFTKVRSVIFDQALAPDLSDKSVKKEWEQYQRGELPHYKVTFNNFWRRLNGQLFNFLKFNARRTIREHHNFYPRLEKLVHSNGVCFTGEWKIDSAANPYTGMLAPNAQGLFIGRASTANSTTKRRQKRPFGLAGKVFPTMDPNQVVPTLNFHTIDNLSGTYAKHFLDVSLTNEPAPGFAITPRLSLAILFAFRSADINIFFRPIDPLSEYPLLEGERVKGPRWIMLKPATSQRVDEIDFRNELDVSKYSGPIEYHIYVSDKTNKTGALKLWQKIGKLTLRESIVSYGCDRQVHFHHNKMKIRRDKSENP